MCYDERKVRRMYAYATFVIMVLATAIVGLAIADNAIGRNFTATIECGNGGAVVGAFVEAERMPRAPFFGWEINSGFTGAHTLDKPSRAMIRYWLPLGGQASVHFGCELLQGTTDQWGTDNRTPIFGGKSAKWTCYGPNNATPPTIVVTDCRRA